MTELFQCQSYYQDGEIRDCTCGKCVVENIELPRLHRDPEVHYIGHNGGCVEYNANELNAYIARKIAATAQAARHEGAAEAIRMVHGRHGITCEKCFDEADVVPQSEVCDTCMGRGGWEFEDGIISPCGTCHGTGRIGEVK